MKDPLRSRQGKPKGPPRPTQGGIPVLPGGVWAALGAVYLVWGSTYLAIRVAVTSFPPFLMAGSRFLISGAVLYLWMRRVKKVPPPRPSHWGPSFLAGFLLLTVGNSGVTWAAAKIPSGIISLLVATVPLWTVLLVWLWKGGAAPGPWTWLGLASGFAGVALLLTPHQIESLGRIGTWDGLLVVVTSLGWSFGAVYLKGAPAPSSPLLSTSMQMLAGGFLQVLTGLLLGEPVLLRTGTVSHPSLAAWVYLTLIGSLVGFTCFIFVLKKASAQLASTYAFVNPVIALFLGWALAGETLSPRVFWAALLVTGAVALITLSPPKKEGGKTARHGL